MRGTAVSSRGVAGRARAALVVGRRRTAVLVGLTGACLVAGALVGVVPSSAAAGPGLGGAAAASGRFFGAGVLAGKLGEAAYVTTLDGQFNSVTPEQELVWDTVEPRQGQFNFTPADRIVDHAIQHGMQVRGQPLVWHSTLPGWVGSLSADGLRSAVQHHIFGMLTHYRGKMASWDVVNEAFLENGSLRDSIFRYRLGATYIEDAFRTARSVDPRAKLCYNDFGIEGVNAKSNAVYAMVKDFRSRGVPLDCVGFQSHFGPYAPIPASFQANLSRFASLGVDVQLTQLDIAGSGATQANDYHRVVLACRTMQRCTGITVWGVTDKYSWQSSQTPLLFDAGYNPKPAYSSTLLALAGIPIEPSLTPTSTTTPSPTTPTPTTPTPTTPTPTTPTPTPTTPSPTTSSPGDATCTAVYATANRWNGGFQGEVTVTAGSSAISGWLSTVTMPPGTKIVNLWNGVPTVTGQVVTVQNAAGNGTLAAGASTSFGFVATAGSDVTSPTVTCGPA